MDNAQKAIMIGVGLFITIIIISAVLLVVNLGTGLMSDATSELGSISGSLRGQILDNWDGKLKSGSEVLAFVRQYANSEAVAIYIKTSAGQVYTGAGVLTANSGSPFASKANYVAGGIQNCSKSPFGSGTSKTSYADIVKNGTISTSAYYNTAVVYDINQNVIGVAIINSK